MPGEGAKHELRVVPCYVEAVFAWENSLNNADKLKTHDIQRTTSIDSSVT